MKTASLPARCPSSSPSACSSPACGGGSTKSVPAERGRRRRLRHDHEGAVQRPARVGKARRTRLGRRPSRRSARRRTSPSPTQAVDLPRAAGGAGAEGDGPRRVGHRQGRRRADRRRSRSSTSREPEEVRGAAQGAGPDRGAARAATCTRRSSREKLYNKVTADVKVVGRGRRRVLQRAQGDVHDAEDARGRGTSSSTARASPRRSRRS